MAQKAQDIELSLEFPDLTQLRNELKQLPSNIAAKHLLAALRAAMKPAVATLRKNTPKGPTGNLRKSVKFKGVKYTKDGNAVGMVGYSWGGGAKGYHQGFLEFGTKERTTKEGRFASSWRAGQFRVVNPRRGKNAGKLTTSPKPPKAFFKTAKRGQQVQLGKMPVGGRTKQPPVRTSFAQSRPQMITLLRVELGTRLEKAIAEVKGRAARGLIT